MSHKSALTVNTNGIARVLISDIGVSLPFIGDQKIQSTDIAIKQFKGIWDTGAVGSVITEKVARELGLKPTGQKEVHTASETVIKNTYLVNIYLPMNVVIQGVTVTEGVLYGDIELLVGMDIITLGDFSITHRSGKTKMSFGIPPSESVDYVEKINKENPKPPISRNDKCHCGSGKKYKHCHGEN